MKSVLLGMLGALAVLVAAAVIYPQYSDYRARAQTSEWLFEVQEAQRAVAANAQRRNSLTGSGVGVHRPNFSGTAAPDYFKVTDDGMIFLKGGSDGQLVVLLPSISGTHVSWACVGGSSKATPSRCRDAP
jgi:hypothetical protein